MPLTLCVPARRLASCQCTTRAMMSGRGEAANNASGSSISPAEPLSSVMTGTCIVLYPQAVAVGNGASAWRLRLTASRTSTYAPFEPGTAPLISSRPFSAS